MDKVPRKGAEEARNQLPDLLQAAEQGRSTIITRQEAFGCGLWGKDVARTLRDEWNP